MSARVLIAYLCIAGWVGALFQSPYTLVLDGRWMALVPASVTVVPAALLLYMVRRDRRAGRLQ